MGLASTMRAGRVTAVTYWSQTRVTLFLFLFASVLGARWVNFIFIINLCRRMHVANPQNDEIQTFFAVLPRNALARQEGLWFRKRASCHLTMYLKMRSFRPLVQKSMCLIPLKKQRKNAASFATSTGNLAPLFR